MRKSIISKIFRLIFSAFFIRILGFVFRIYLSKVSGAEGCGLYQLVLSVYAFGAGISAFGIRETLSKLVAQKEKYSKRILKTALVITGSISLLMFVITYINSEYIAYSILKDSRVLKSIRVISFSFPAIAVFSSISGYFNGLLRVKYCANGQIIEQITRILFVFLFAKEGLKYGLENGIKVMSLGIVIGEYVSMLYIYVSYRFFASKRQDTYIKKTFFTDIMKLSLPIASGGYIASLIHTMENVLMPTKLIEYGLTRGEGVSILGIIKGMAGPVVFLPTVIIGAVSVLTLPEISKVEAYGNFKRIKHLTFKTLFSGFVTGILSFFLLNMFSDCISGVLYDSLEPSYYIKTMSVVLPFLFFNILSSSILNGMGLQFLTMTVNIFSGVVKLMFVILVVPYFGIKGYLLGYILSEGTGFLVFLALIYTKIYSKKGVKNKFYLKC
ncbi:MAG: hypothetical protein E7405_00120 [Ruminococcaceae bacterium]|nr:hypothetical protein [Oscillospiraceae bacterium]